MGSSLGVLNPAAPVDIMCVKKKRFESDFSKFSKFPKKFQRILHTSKRERERERESRDIHQNFKFQISNKKERERGKDGRRADFDVQFDGYVGQRDADRSVR